MLADLDDPPRSRIRGILLGIAIAAPLTIAIGMYVLPVLYQMMMGAAKTIDQQNEAKSLYMRAVCTEGMILERDEKLCKCTMASDLPAIDCQFQFEEWTLLRQIEQCNTAEKSAEALSFCTCVKVLAEELSQSSSNPAEQSNRGEIIHRYDNCTKLDDALFLPEIKHLIDTWDPQLEAKSKSARGS